MEWDKQLGLIQIFSRNFSAAVEACLKAVELARAAGLHHDLAASMHNLAEATLRLGDYTRAHAMMIESTNEAAAFGLGPIVSLNRMYLAFFDGVEGLREADEHLRALIHDAEHLGYWQDALEGHARFPGDAREALRDLGDVDR